MQTKSKRMVNRQCCLYSSDEWLKDILQVHDEVFLPAHAEEVHVGVTRLEEGPKPHHHRGAHQQVQDKISNLILPAHHGINIANYKVPGCNMGYFQLR